MIRLEHQGDAQCLVLFDNLADRSIFIEAMKQLGKTENVVERSSSVAYLHTHTKDRAFYPYHKV